MDHFQMPNQTSIVAIYDSQHQAENAIRELQKSNFDLKKLSIVGKDYNTDVNVTGYYELEDAAVESGYSTLGAALVSIGIPKDSILLYEENVRIGRFLLVLHGTPWEVERAKERLDNHRTAETTVHAGPVAVCV
jgi:hypothetical protein